MRGWRFEPTLITEAVRQVVLALVLFNVINWNEQQIAGALMALSAVLALFARELSIPTETVRRAGTSPEQLKADAAVIDAAIAKDKPVL